jgi:hypothetical protein
MATYAQEQAEDLLKYYQGMIGTARQPTALSSREEQRAFQAQDVRGGDAPIEMLPEQYGGRPTGESRRAIRMQEAYDARQAQLLQQQRVMQQMEQEQKEIAIREQEQQSRIENMNIARDAALAKAAREAKVKEQSRNIREAFLGSTLPDGSKILPINLNEDDAPERIQRTLYMNDFGMEDQATKEMASMLLDDAFRIREKKANDIDQRTKVDMQTITDLTKLAKLTERNTSDLFAIDPKTKDVIVDPSAVGEAQADLALREKKGEAKGPSYSDLNKDAGVLRGKIRDINLDIIVENNLYNKAKSDKDKSLAQSRIEQLEAQRDFLSTEYLGLQSILEEGAAGGGTAQPEILKFATPEEAEAAGLDAGTIVEIGGRRARID